MKIKNQKGDYFDEMIIKCKKESRRVKRAMFIEYASYVLFGVLLLALTWIACFL